MPANTVVTIRKGSATAWSTANPVLASGEPGFDTTNTILKIGDGVTSWSNLNSFTTSSSSVDVRSDTVGNTSYIGRATAGSATSSSVWKIRRSIFTSAGNVSSSVTATNVKWDDRLTATYS